VGVAVAVAVDVGFEVAVPVGVGATVGDGVGDGVGVGVAVALNTTKMYVSPATIVNGPLPIVTDGNVTVDPTGLTGPVTTFQPWLALLTSKTATQYIPVSALGAVTVKPGDCVIVIVVATCKVKYASGLIFGSPIASRCAMLRYAGVVALLGRVPCSPTVVTVEEAPVNAGMLTLAEETTFLPPADTPPKLTVAPAAGTVGVADCVAGASVAADDGVGVGAPMKAPFVPPPQATKSAHVATTIAPVSGWVNFFIIKRCKLQTGSRRQNPGTWEAAGGPSPYAKDAGNLAGVFGIPRSLSSYAESVEVS